MTQEQWIGLGVVLALVLIFAVRSLLKRGKTRPQPITLPPPPPAPAPKQRPRISLAHPTGMGAGDTATCHFSLEVPQGAALAQFHLRTKFPLGQHFPEVPLDDLFDITFISDPDNLEIIGRSKALDANGVPLPVMGPVLARPILKAPMTLLNGDGQQFPLDGSFEDGEGPLLFGDGIALPPLPKKDIIKEDIMTFFSGPSWERFFRVCDIGIVAGFEAAIKAGWDKAVSETKDFVELSVPDQPTKDEMLGDLTRMNAIFQSRVKARMEDIITFGDLPRAFEPPPPAVPDWYVLNDGTDLRIETKDPELDFDSHYKFFKHPKAKIKLGNLGDALKEMDPNLLFFKDLGFQIDIFEEKAELIEPVDPENPEHERQEYRWMRSKLSIELGAKNLLKPKPDDPAEPAEEPKVYGSLNYTFQDRPGKPIFIMGVSGNTERGWKNNEWSVMFGISWGSNPVEP